MNRKSLTGVSIIICAVGYTILSQYADGNWKPVVGIIASIPLTYSLLNLIWKDKPWLKRLNWILRHIHIIKIFVPAPEVKVRPQQYKPAVLKGVMTQCESRLAQITSPDIFIDDFEIEPEYKPGSQEEDTNKDWRQPDLTKRFCAITGEAGSGKSYELVKRVHALCKDVKAQVDSDPNAIIPLYVELGTLNTALDDEWLETYIYKTYNLLRSEYANDAGVKIKREWVQVFMEKKEEIVFFFDGVDEIPESCRMASLEYIAALTYDSGVTICCRKKEFDEFDELYGFFSTVRNRIPTEYHLAPMTTEQMLEVIDRLAGKTAAEKEEMKVFINKKAKDSSYNKDEEGNPLSRSIVFALFVKIYNSLPEKTKEELLVANLERTLNILWESYEDYAIKKLPNNADILGLRTYAVWIAKIIPDSPGSFYVESIQPNWLQKVTKGKQQDADILRGLYYLSTRIIAAVMIGFSLDLIACTPFSLLSNSVSGGIVISVLAWVYKRVLVKRKYAWFIDTLFVIVMLAFLVGICSVYQGFSVPRYNEQGLPVFFSQEETRPGILLGLLLCIVFSYRIIIEKKTKKYIQPVDRYQFKPIHAIGYAIIGGIISGLFVGAAGWYASVESPKALFIQNWLIPYITQLWYDKFGIKLLNPSAQLRHAIFLYAFTVAFTVISILIAVLVGRYDDDEEKEHPETGKTAARQRMHFGITAWASKAFKRSLMVLFIAGGIYYGAMLILSLNSWFFLVKIAIGAAAASFLWFGGIEAINHTLLRLSLSARGIAPKQYDEWVEATRRAALIRQQAYKMGFYHSTLKNYYNSRSLQNNTRIRVKERVWKDTATLGIVTAFLCLLLLLPFAMRYYWDWYWPNPYQLSISQQDITKAHWRKMDSGAYQIMQPETVVLRAHGCIQVGTFVGLVLSPAGTKEGYMGMPIKSSYNIPYVDTSYAHAALLVRQYHNGTWTKYAPVRAKERDTLPLTLKAGDKLQFMVNDREYQNNLGKYTVTIDTIANNKKKYLLYKTH